MSSGQSTVGDSVFEPVTESPAHLCTMCGEPISKARLKVIPFAATCVPCLEASGDVPLTKQYDELGRDGIIETSRYTHNISIERQRRRMNFVVPSDEDFDIAAGDDQHLKQERRGAVAIGRHLSTEFINEPDSRVPNNYREKRLITREKTLVAAA